MPYRLLVIDDDESVARSVQVIAEGCGYEVRMAQRADAFFRLVDEWVPTHVVLDLQMPDVDGIEVLRQLGNMGLSAEIIVASGVDGRIVDSVRRLGVEHGLHMSGTLLKPFRAAELRKLLQQHTRAA